MRLEPFERIVLIYGIEWRPGGFIDATRLLGFVQLNTNPFVAVVDSLERLEDSGLILIRRSRSSVRFRRTAQGMMLGQRLMRDSRISFMKAVGDP